MQANKTNLPATQTSPMLIGTVVRFHTADPKTRMLGIIRSVRAGSITFPGWHYDIAWTGATCIDRAVPAYLVTIAA